MNNKCSQSIVARDGSLPRYCNSTITGFVGFKKRMELSLEASNLHPISPDTTHRAGGVKTSLGLKSESFSPLKSVAPKVPQSLYKPQLNNSYVPR